MGAGFIHGKLEIKFLILYIMARVNEPIRIDEVQSLTMIDDGIDYFGFSECLNDLVRTEHLKVSDDAHYAITAKGRKNSEICQSSLAYSVRLRADKLLDEFNRELKRKSQVKGRYTRRDNGTYTVELSLSDDVDSIFNLQLMVANERSAHELTSRFEQDPEEIYGKLIQALFP